MTGWREWAYPVPDDEFKTLERIMRLLPDGGEFETVWEAMPYFVVELADPSAAVFLRLVVNHAPPPGVDGSSLLGENEVWIAENERAECERMLAENCPSPAVWKAVAQVAFVSDEAHCQFRAAYAEVMEELDDL